MTGMRETDRRVRRTKGLLQEALTALIHEKPYEAIAVKEILARADVGRTAFYAHFQNKDELLVSAFRDAVRAGAQSAAGAAPRPADPVARVLRFSGPLFERIAHVRESGYAMEPVAHNAAIHARLRAVLQEHVVAEVGGAARTGAGASAVPLDLLAVHVADTFLLVLTWWVESGDARSAPAVDTLFRSLVDPVLASSFGWTGT